MISRVQQSEYPLRIALILVNDFIKWRPTQTGTVISISSQATHSKANSMSSTSTTQITWYWSQNHQIFQNNLGI